MNWKKIHNIKKFVQPKMSLNNMEFPSWKMRERGGQVGGWAGGQVSWEAY
jgi:hypothetical protein